MRTLLVICILASHAMAVWPFVLTLRRRQLPRATDFACVSVLAYYGLGLALETWANVPSPAGFRALFKLEPDVLAWTLCLIIATPWLLRWRISTSRSEWTQSVPKMVRLRQGRKTTFFILATLASSATAVYGARVLMRGLPIWALRSELGEHLGPWVIVLYVPLYLLAYLLTVEDCKGRAGLLLSVWLVFASALSTLATGQRTLILAPVLMLLLFRKTPGLSKLVVLGAAGVVAAAILLPLFKSQYEASELSVVELFLDTIQNDFNRVVTLGKCVEMAPAMGSRVMPYPLSGYVYSALFFIPRSIAPFKGESTAKLFTAAVLNARVDSVDWGFGIGLVEESVLNVGLLGAPLLIVLYGAALRTLDRIGSTGAKPGIAVAVRLGALWCCGYHLPALLQTFGGAALLALFLNPLFAERCSSPAPIPKWLALQVRDSPVRPPSRS